MTYFEGDLKRVLTIAGSDSSGGAGIQADLKTMTVLGVYGMSVVTALTAQNTMGVSGILEVPADFVDAQMDAVFSDIFPDSVKIGMLSNASIIQRVAEKLKEYKALNIVVDPVMVSTSGSDLMKSDSVEALLKHLIPMAGVVTPNKFEAEILSGLKIESERDMERAAEAILAHGCEAVLVKGGHFGEQAGDFLLMGGEGRWFTSPRIDNPNTHGTGCTLSSAIAVYLAKGWDMAEATRQAKEYLTGAIGARLDIGRGRGPLNHMYRISE